MSYRHSVIDVSEKERKLATIAAEAGGVLAALPYVPKVHFFKEDHAGRYPREVRCLGFVDFRSSSSKLDVFCRIGLEPRQMVETIFHECEHIAQYHRGEFRTADEEGHETRAHTLSLMAPCGYTYESVFSELARGLVKASLRRDDYTAAQRYHEQLRLVDPEEANKLSNAVLTPHERRLKIKMEAERIRRETESEVKAKEAAKEFKRWKRTIQVDYNPILERRGARW